MIDAKELRHASQHEAAHAVVAHSVGEKVVAIGRWFCDVQQSRDPMRTAIIALAGSIAESSRPRRRPLAWSPGDMRAVLKLGFSGPSIGTLADLAAEQVRINWPAIKAVARELVRVGSLDRKAFLRVLRAGVKS